MISSASIWKHRIAAHPVEGLSSGLDPKRTRNNPATSRHYGALRPAGFFVQRAQPVNREDSP